MTSNIKFNSFYCGTAILWSNTPYTKEEIIKNLLESTDGEWCPGYYKFVIIN